MDESEDGALQNFKSFTGSRNDAEARQLLEACNGDVALAVDLYFQGHQPQSSPSASAATCSEVGPVTRRRIAHRSSARLAEQSQRNHSNNEASASSQSDNNDICMIDGDDNVRAPIAPVRGAIVEQSFSEQYQGRTRRIANSVFDSFRHLHGEVEHVVNGAGRGTDYSRRSTLQALFRPPIEIIFRGDWESARAEAQRINSWLLVNIQDVQEFACQTLNRDVWANTAVKELIRSNFLFWQIYHDSPDGVRIGNYYRIHSYPSIFVVDPRTGELLTHFRAQDAVSFCDQVTSFLDTFPDFGARDRHLVGAAAPTPSSDPTPSVSSERNRCTDMGSDVVSSSSGARKRTVNSSSEDQHGEGADAKKARISGCSSDIEEIVNGGNKLTTVDCDEWRGYLGVADGQGSRISLMLRLPDGNRKNVEMEDTTTLKAVFMLIAGLGFAYCDHLLVLFYPKREYSYEDADRTLRELSFNKQEVIHVERK